MMRTILLLFGGLLCLAIGTALMPFRETNVLIVPEPVVIAPLPKSTPSPKPEPEKITPYTVAEYVEDTPDLQLGSFWERLGPNVAPEFMPLCNRCDSEVFSYDLDNVPGDEKIVRISDTMEHCGYLVFREDGIDDWTVVGSMMHDFGRYEMPKHSFVEANGVTLLVIRVQTQSGSGVSAYENNVFMVHEGKMRTVATIPSDGHQSDVILDREYDAKITGAKLYNNSVELSVRLNARYNVWDGDTEFIELFKSVRHAVFHFSFTDMKAKLDPKRSDLTQGELDASYNVDTLSLDDFLRYNRHEMEFLEHSGSKHRARLIRDFRLMVSNISEERCRH